MKEFRFPKSDMLMGLIRQFSPTEKAIFIIFTIVFMVTSFSLAWKLNNFFMVEIPARGGSLNEGVIGIARFVNPVLAQTDVDRDITALVYSGLMRNINGILTPDLAESYTISDDGLVYTFNLKEKAVFHDGVMVTADDVAYTIEKAQDSVIKSPRRGAWNDVAVEVVNSHQIKFIIKHPFAPFIENTTLGILPKHLWKDIDSDSFVFSKLNSDPIGSGPYKIDSIVQDDRGLPTKYNLISNKTYILGQPFITHILITFFPNEKALLEAYYEGLIDSLHSIPATETAKIADTRTDSTILHTSLPRTFALFFNQNQSPALAQPEVRKALDIAIDRNEIIGDVLKGYGVESSGPLPIHTENIDVGDRIAKARDILTKAGWTLNSNGIFEKKGKKDSLVLDFSITTTNATELKRAAEIIKQRFEKIGAQVSLKIYENGDLHQNIIRPRKYDTLLFGEVVGRDLDLYAYWHSSQRNDPGLNIVLYANSKVDKLLEDIRTITDRDTRKEKAEEVQTLITNDTPAAFLYSPDLIYITSKQTHIPTIDNITTPSDRFGNIMKWYVSTDHVWKIFVKNK